MSSSDPPLLSTSFTSKVTSSSNSTSNIDNTTVDISDCPIKSEPDSEDSSSPEDVKNINGNSNDNASFQKHKENMTLKSEFVKKDTMSSEEGNSPSRINMTDKSSPPYAPPQPPKKSFMTSHIVGDIESAPSVSPVRQDSPAVVVSTSSVTCSMTSPNDSNFSSNGASPNSSNRGSVCSPTNSITSKTTSPMSSPPTSTFPQTHLLFQPFLPYNQHQPPSQQSLLHHSNLKHQHSRTHPNVPQMVQRALPFSIDNILKPTFGRGDDDASALANHLFSPFLGASLASSILQHHHQQQQNLLQQAAAAHAVNTAVSAAANSTLKENSLSSGPIGQFPPSAFNHRGDIISPSGSSLSSPRSPTYSSSSVPPMGSCKPRNYKIKQEPPPPAKSPEKGTLPKEAVEEALRSSKKSNSNPNQPVDLSKSADENENKDDDEDLPPGMVRGPNGQLWPAWVFCTRYSDRPSSGKYPSYICKYLLTKLSKNRYYDVCFTGY